MVVGEEGMWIGGVLFWLSLLSSSGVEGTRMSSEGGNCVDEAKSLLSCSSTCCDTLRLAVGAGLVVVLWLMLHLYPLVDLLLFPNEALNEVYP
jgi:hypothetical protein